MKTRSTLSIILAVSLAVALALAGWFAWLYYRSDNSPQPNSSPPVQTKDKDEDRPSTDEPQPTTAYTSEGGKSIIVSHPSSGSQVTSPLVVKGTVPGSWSFEASFPIHLLDANRQLITTAPATLTGDWMTESQVPFSAQLEFSDPETSTGYLIIEKSNPSDLAANADRVEIPIRFK